MESTPRKRFKSDKKDKTSNKKTKRGKSQAKPQKPQITFLRISEDEDGISIPFEFWVEPIKTCIKSKGAIWCPIFKIWKLPRVKMQFVKQQLSEIIDAQYRNPPFFVSHASQPSKQQLVIGKQKYKKKLYESQQNPLYQKLYPFQRQTLEFCLQHHGRILIADEMGVGKSIQALACCLIYNRFPLLIIAPSALKDVWKAQVMKWFKNIVTPQQVIVIKKGALNPGQLDAVQVMITSYEIAAKLTEQLSQVPTVICDESHYLKNSSSNRCEKLMPFLTRKQRIFLLTGTPALAQPKQLFPLLSILRPDMYLNIHEFGNRYCHQRVNPWSFKRQFNGAKNMAQLHYILKTSVMIRRMKANVLPQLPAKQRQYIPLETQKSIVKQIKILMSTSISIQNLRNSQKLLSQFNSSQSDTRNALMKCYQLTGIAKLYAAKQYISALIDGQAKIIVFAHHKAVMDELEIHLQSLKCGFIKLDGSVSTQTRKKKVDKFQEEYDIKVALLSITALGLGFTLTAASTVVFVQLHWTPALLIQAQDRTHRIGQLNSVNVHYLIGENTIDPLMIRQLQRKLGVVNRVLNGQKQQMEVQMLQKGAIGDYEPQVKSKQTKGGKITDYFQKIRPLKTEKMQQQKQKAQSQEQKQQRIEYSQQSQDSMVMAFIKLKKQGNNQK